MSVELNDSSSRSPEFGSCIPNASSHSVGSVEDLHTTESFDENAQLNSVTATLITGGATGLTAVSFLSFICPDVGRRCALAADRKLIRSAPPPAIRSSCIIRTLVQPTQVTSDGAEGL